MPDATDATDNPDEIDLLDVLKGGLPTRGAISSGVINAYAIHAGLRDELPKVHSAQPI